VELRRDGAVLAYDDTGEGRPAVVLLHGWGGDRPLFERLVGALAGPGLDEPARSDVLHAGAAPSQSVLVHAMEALLAYDSVAAARETTCPLLYVGTDTEYADLERFRALCPQLRTARLSGCGHFFPLEAPARLAGHLAPFIDAQGR